MPREQADRAAPGDPPARPDQAAQEDPENRAHLFRPARPASCGVIDRNPLGPKHTKAKEYVP